MFAAQGFESGLTPVEFFKISTFKRKTKLQKRVGMIVILASFLWVLDFLFAFEN